jgi:hypothetical protein
LFTSAYAIVPSVMSADATLAHVAAPLASSERGNWLVQLVPAYALGVPVPALTVFSSSPVVSVPSENSPDRLASAVFVMKLAEVGA